jgi:uncharacterized protein (TIGR00296 family)
VEKEAIGNLKKMASHCFDTLIADLQGKKTPVNNLSAAKLPLFVTWEKCAGSGKKVVRQATRQYELRGCIGSFKPGLPLSKSVGEYALCSAKEDDRFPTISMEEVPQLKVSVSILINFAKKPLDDPLKFVIGKHGVSLDLTHKGKKYSSTFLPEVAPEQGWNQTDTIAELLEKAEYEGNLTHAI